jgi:DNA repair exonuclease SbcCD nuclease subunit
MSDKLYLLVGDPHVVVDELYDAEALLQLILKLVAAARYNGVVFLGDLHHNHSNVRVEVMQFWRKAFSEIRAKSLASDLTVHALVGNHDRPADANSTAHALQAYQDLVTAVDDPMWLTPGVIMLPYYHDPLKFIGACIGYVGAETLVCHQTFAAAKYENGFYAPDGVDPKDIPQEQVISGHIHTPQEFGKVWYPGAPRWRISTDANVYRALQAVTFDEDGKLTSRCAFSTDTYCRKLIDLTFEEGKDQTMPELNGPAAISISLCGSPEWVEGSRKYWESSPNVTTRSFPTRERNAVVRESQGISKALEVFVEGFQVKNGTPVETIKAMVAERVRL